MVFPVVMYGCESWTIRKAEYQRFDAFELWYWRRLLRVPWTARRANQSILKEISPEYSLEGLMLKLKLQYFGHLMQRTDSLEKTLMLGKIEGRKKKGWDGWMASPTQWTWVWVSWELVMVREAWRAAVHRVTKSWTRLSHWTELSRRSHLSEHLLYIWYVEMRELHPGDSSWRVYIHHVSEKLQISSANSVAVELYRNIGRQLYSIFCNNL